MESIITALKKLFRKVTSQQEKEIKIKYPKAIVLKNKPLMVRGGTYSNNFPEGAIIHFTAGHSEQKGTDAIDWANKNGHRYFFIDQEGVVHQQFCLTGYGAHAGESICPVTNRTMVSKHYVGIEIACEGYLGEDMITDWGKRIPPERTRAGVINNPWQKSAGVYETFTEKQEIALKELLHWLCENGMHSHLIFGHDEVSGKRKNDPGLSLSITMEELRKAIRNSL